jgi:hypothetical protein
VAKEKYCDFRCWNATGSICRCHCGGDNHGKGQANQDPVFKELMEDPEIRKHGFSQAAYDRLYTKKMMEDLQ